MPRRGRGRVGRDGDRSIRPGEIVPVALQGIKYNCSERLGENTEKEILCKQQEKQNQQLTTVDNRFIREKTTALRFWLLTSVSTKICLCKLFSYKAYPVMEKQLAVDN